MLQHPEITQGTCWVCTAATQRGPRLPSPSCPSSERAGRGKDVVPHLPGTEQAASEPGVGTGPRDLVWRAEPWPSQGSRGGACTAGSTAPAEQAPPPGRTSWMVLRSSNAAVNRQGPADGPPLLKRSSKGAGSRAGSKSCTPSLGSTAPTLNFHLARQVALNPRGAWC